MRATFRRGKEEGGAVAEDDTPNLLAAAGSDRLAGPENSADSCPPEVGARHDLAADPDEALIERIERCGGIGAPGTARLIAAARPWSQRHVRPKRVFHNVPTVYSRIRVIANARLCVNPQRIPVA